MTDEYRFAYRTFVSPEYVTRAVRKKANRVMDEHRKWIRRHRDARLPHPENGEYPLKPWHLKRMRVAERQRARKMLINIDDTYSFSARRWVDGRALWVDGYALWMSAVTRALKGGP